MYSYSYTLLYTLFYILIVVELDQISTKKSWGLGG